jgi:hypothetical protein
MIALIEGISFIHHDKTFIEILAPLLERKPYLNFALRKNNIQPYRKPGFCRRSEGIHVRVTIPARSCPWPPRLVRPPSTTPQAIAWQAGELAWQAGWRSRFVFSLI